MAWPLLRAGNTAPCPWAPGYMPPLAPPREPPWVGVRELSRNQASSSDSLVKLPPHRSTLLVSLGCQGASHFTNSPWPGANWLVSQVLGLRWESPRDPQSRPAISCLPAHRTSNCVGKDGTEGRWGGGTCSHRGGKEPLPGCRNQLVPRGNAGPSHGHLSTQALAPALGSPSIRALCRDGDAHLQSLGFPRNAQNQWLLHA